MAVRIFLAILMACGTLIAESGAPGNLPIATCGGPAKEDDTLVCYIGFKSDPMFASLQITFTLKSAQDSDDRGLPAIFTLSDSEHVCPGVYEVSGILPHVSRGRYRPSWVRAAAGPRDDRTYMSGYALSTRTMVDVKREDLTGSSSAAESSPEKPIFDQDHIPNPLPGPNPAIRVADLTGSPFKTASNVDSALGSGGPEPQKVAPGNGSHTPDKAVYSSRNQEPGVPPTSSAPPVLTIVGQSNEKRLVEIGPVPPGLDPNLFPALLSIQGKTRLRPCEGGHRPGDKVTCYVTFAGDSDFIELEPYFSTRQVPFEQHGLCGSFPLSYSRKISRHWYRTSGTLPPCASGSYVLSSLRVRTWAGEHYYRNGWDYKNQFPVIRLDNDDQTVYPEITYVGPAPPCNPGPDRK